MSANKNDKVAIVTGSATGIGFETALHLARNGFYTYATMRNLQKASQIDKISKTEHLPLDVIQLDVTDNISITKAIDKVIAERGRIDVLINNAGYGLIGSIEDMSVEELKAQFETNFFGVFRVTRAILPHMRQQYSGTIINISSIAGHIGFPLYSAHVSSKFALEGLSESMVYELQPFGIKVVIIDAGPTNTNFKSKIAARAAEKESPYHTMTQLTVKAIEGMVRGGGGIHPHEVAKVIIDAINSSEHKLRYIVGKDAEELIEDSKRLSEQELFQKISQSVFKTV
jgi:NAD(P)-dependent dehydrogenase (short-subunit alcohol dehydrogenase family)